MSAQDDYEKLIDELINQTDRTKIWDALKVPNDFEVDLLFNAILNDDTDLIYNLVSDMNKNQASFAKIVNSFDNKLSNVMAKNTFLTKTINRTLAHRLTQKVRFPSVMRCGATLLMYLAYQSFSQEKLKSVEDHPHVYRELQRTFNKIKMVMLGVPILTCFNDGRRMYRFTNEYLRDLKNFRQSKKFLKEVKSQFLDIIANPALEKEFKAKALKVKIIEDNSEIIMKNLVERVDSKISETEKVATKKDLRSRLKKFLNNKEIDQSLKGFAENFKDLSLKHQGELKEIINKSSLEGLDGTLNSKEREVLESFDNMIGNYLHAFPSTKVHDLYRNLIRSQKVQWKPFSQNAILSLRNFCFYSIGIMFSLESYIVSLDKSNLTDFDKFLVENEIRILTLGASICVLTSSYSVNFYRKLKVKINWKNLNHVRWKQLRKSVLSKNHVNNSTPTGQLTDAYDFYQILDLIDEQFDKKSQFCKSFLRK